jgi:hypothetical protein
MRRNGINVLRPCSLRHGAGIATGIVAILLGSLPVRAQQPTATMEDLRWISGVWSLNADGRVTEEHWLEPASNALIGVGRTLQQGRMVFFEFLRIEARPEGVFYVAQPAGNPPTAFRLSSWDGRTATFENREHDFPKRIHYTRTDANTLTARIDGGAGEERGAQTFTYTRVRR